MMILNLLVNCYGWNGTDTEALKLYHQLPQELTNEVTNACVLSACLYGGLVDEVRSIFRNIQNKTSRIIGAMVCEIDCSMTF